MNWTKHEERRLARQQKEIQALVQKYKDQPNDMLHTMLKNGTPWQRAAARRILTNREAL